MPATEPRPEDPGTIGGYRVRGRLGAGGQGVVYLAEAPDGRPVAVKVLLAADEEAAALLRREAEILPKIATFCTAQVLEVGTAGDAPYVVSEYVEGPTLQQAVAARGPLRGRELHRLAVGTITALAAIHRAGVVHRDFKPGNVLLSPEGPRVIDFGIARPAGVADVPGEDLMGTPPYMAPEQFRLGVGGPAADLFAWGSTMVFAATGTPAFGTGALPAIVNRIVNSEPDLGPLDDDLREAVAACLAKDPADRPAARQVLLRLLGRPAEAATDATSPQELTAGVTRASTTRPGRWPSTLVPFGEPGPRRRRLVVMAAAVAAVIVAASVALAVLRPWAVTLATSGPLATDTHVVKVPELGATLHEHPSDPLRVTSFLRGSTELTDGLAFRAGLRAVGGDTFRPLTSRMLPLVSPSGERTAAIHESPGLAVENAGGVRFTDRDLGGEFWVHVVDPPLALRRATWSEEGDRLLVTVFDTAAEDRTVGFAVVDPAERTATVTRRGAPESGKADYTWGPDEDTVARASGPDRISVHALDGAVRRTIGQVALAEDEVPRFSGDGRLIARCPGRTDTACVLDAATGRRLATVPLPEGGKVWFWYGRDHLAVYTEKSVPPRTQAIDLTGRPVRVLAEFTGGTSWTVHYGVR
ncbi:serine/threonine-protein kinase [Nonomuraea sp. ZG12]|uniref:serine/threonine-protein kinase n=1 Tax=Nonomuraea sp. ZG12 TaxID=3452207 RepID=UPI003F8B196F